MVLDINHDRTCRGRRGSNHIDLQRESGFCKSPREIYTHFIKGFFSRPAVLPFGVILAIIRLTYGLVETDATLCLLEKYAAILYVTKGVIELMMFWTPLIVFRCCNSVEQAIQNPCFELYVYAFTLTEFALFCLEMVWCLGYYNEAKTICPSFDPDWHLHFAKFAISQTVIDGIIWIGTFFAFCFLTFQRREYDGVQHS